MVAAASDDTAMDEKVEVDLNEDDGDEIDSDQLLEYQEMLEFLGNFADKVLINTLSMIAEDFANQPKSARAIYGCIRDFLVSSNTSVERKLPLVYVVDSILKNVNSLSSSGSGASDKRKNNPYVSIMEEDANEWLPIVYNALQSKDNNGSAARLKKVWYTWKEFGIFSQEIWEQMGQCFTTTSTTTSTTTNNIPKMSDGTLKVLPALRKEMQLILDEMQQDVEDELEKVSLERLAELNPELIQNIQQTAQDILDNKNSSKTSADGDGLTSTTMSTNTATTDLSNSSIFMEWRPPHVVERAAEWEKIMMGSNTHMGTSSSNHSSCSSIQDQTSQLISKLHTTIRNSTSSTQIYSSEQDAIQQIQLLASVSVTASHLTTALQKLKIQQNQHGQMPGVPSTLYSASVQTQFHRTHIDKSQFTTDGLKVKNESVIARLYDAGLPFVSSSDGRRFATQLLLSQHLDELFRQTQLEKNMERTDERGWYIPHWSYPQKEQVQSSNSNHDKNENDSQTNINDAMSKYADPDACTVPADDSRDRCVICGMHFTMFFDQDDGEWKYSNCREISVENDLSKELLVHVKCWNSLGSPTHLPPDQVRQ